MSQLPFLPGYRVDTERLQKKKHHKKHMFDVTNGIRVDATRELKKFPVSGNPLALSNGGATADGSGEVKMAVDAKFAPEDTMSRLPAWVAYDRRVLRFFCFFKEAVTSSSTETWRTRKCVLYFYLEDDSVHIAEPKIENSGIPQGVFVKRHRIPKANNEYIGLDDLFVGNELAIYGRVFRIIDCDDFTRAFFQSKGVQMPEAEKYPLDPFTKKHTYRPHTHHKLMNPLKNFMEASLGKPMNYGVDATQQFLKNDGRVLRFYCTWNDTKMYGERRPYIMHYFLADDTVEILEIQQPNSGRDPFPSLLKRQRLPKNWDQNAPTVPRIGYNDDQKIRYYTEADLKVGAEIEVFGRGLFLCGCDRFTQEFYMENYNMKAEEFPKLQMADEAEEVPKMAPPEHNGFGSEEDSLGSFLYLMPKVPKRDFKKLMENDGMNLRFLAKFVNPQPEDRDRRFITTYYLNNDTLGIFEKFERNSGFVGGKFLERMRVRNPESREYYKAADFKVGARIRVNQYQFELLEADQYTTKFMQNNPAVFGEEQSFAPSEASPTGTTLPRVQSPNRANGGGGGGGDIPLF